MYYTIDIEDSSKLYFTSDLHFNHFNICSFCHRPYASRIEMNNALIENWNNTIKEDDVVICCGDFVFGRKVSFQIYHELSKKLNGNIYLVRGNHDRVELSYTPIGHFKAIVDSILVNVDNKKVICTHFPLLCFPYDYNAFGHIHTEKDGLCHGTDAYVNDILDRKRQYDVGVDQNDYKPISYEEFINKMK